MTGRSTDKLKKLEQELPGVNTYTMDMTQHRVLGKDIATLFMKFPNIDTVWINGGILRVAKIQDINSSTDEDIENEVATNVTAPFIIARHVIPRLLAKDRETTIMITGSGLGFMPSGALFPVYCSTKAAIHSYCVGIRQALKGTKLNVIELVPPLVDTGLAADFKDLVNVPSMTLSDFVDDSFLVLDNELASSIKEIAPGTAGPRVRLWRESIGKAMAERGLDD